MRPRDMAKFGQICLNKGFWRNRKIVSEKWLTESTSYQIHSKYGMEYGYLWWRGRQTVDGQMLEAFWAQGNGGQVIFVYQTMGLVAVFTGGNYNSIYEFQFMGMLVNHILPAMLSPGPEKTFVAMNKQMIKGCFIITRQNEMGTYKRPAFKPIRQGKENENLLEWIVFYHHRLLRKHLGKWKNWIGRRKT